MQEFFNNVKSAFTDFGPVDALVIVLFALVFYYVFRILKTSNVRSVIAVFAVLVVATGIIFISDSNLKGDAFMVIDGEGEPW